MRAHLLETLARTPVHARPFAHFYVERVLPDDIYAAVLRHLPAASRYRPDNPKKYTRADGVATRSVMRLDEPNIAALPEAQSELWGGITEGLSAPEIKDAVFRMLSRDLTWRFFTTAEGLRHVAAFPRPLLVRDLPGYWIEPHPDTQAKIVTMQLYLAHDDAQAGLGTTIYRLRWRKLWRLWSPGSALEPFKTFAFRPNTGYAFAVGRISWHGREKISDDAGVRNSLMHIYYREAGT